MKFSSRAQRRQKSPELSERRKVPMRGGGTNKPARFEGGATEQELAGRWNRRSNTKRR
jgi:hypothetical protein